MRRKIKQGDINLPPRAFVSVEKNPYQITLIFENDTPLLPNEALGRNPHYHRNNARRWKKKITQLVVAALRPETPLKKARIEIVRESSNMLDYDSLVMTYKPCVDGLTEACVIQNDSWSVVGAWHVTQKYRPRKEGPRFSIRVTSLEETDGMLLVQGA